MLYALTPARWIIVRMEADAAYDVGEDEQRLVFYALLLAEAQREDLERFMHCESLVRIWPRLRQWPRSSDPRLCALACGLRR